MSKQHPLIVSLVLVGCLLILTQPGCDNRITRVQMVSPQELLPLNRGNYWIYESEYKIGDVVVETSLDTVLVDTAMLWNNQNWWGYSSSDSVFYRSDSLGVWQLRFDSGYHGRQELMIKYPAQVGDYWYLHPVPDDSVKFEVFATSTTASTPAGNINGCFKYGQKIEYAEDDVYYVYIWFKPGLGRVRSENRTTVVPGYFEDRTHRLTRYFTM